VTTGTDRRHSLCPAPLVDTAEEPARSHHVEFYETEEFLVDTVSDFPGSSLRDGEATIAIADATHRRASEAALDASEIDSTAAVNRYLALDAAELLQKFMIDGTPDASVKRLAR
jgi:hypothetical protein